MKSTAFLALIMATTATAMAADAPFGGFDGHLSVAAGTSDTSTSNNWSESRGNYAFGGSLAYTGQSGFGGQIDYLHFQHGWNDGRFADATTTDLVGHLSYRTNTWLLGGFVDNRRFYFAGNYSDTQRLAGVEAKWFLKDMTLYGQLGRNDWRRIKNDGPFAAVQLNYYLNDNFRVSAGVDRLENQNPQGTYKYAQTGLGLGAEYRFERSHFSGFVSYTHMHEAYNSGWKRDTDTLMLGVKLNFGQDSLRKSDQAGATLAPPPRVMQSGDL